MLFKKTRIIKKEIQDYLDKTLETVLVFYQGSNDYFSQDYEALIQHVKKIKELERELDDLRRDIEFKLYSYMLLPDSRGDIMELLERLDDIANQSSRALLSIELERPPIPSDFFNAFNKILDLSRDAADQLIAAFTAYFTNSRQLKTHTQKVKFYEREIDQYEERLKREIFANMEFDLAQKIQLRDFVDLLASISDCAEDISERLIISSLKRAI